MLEMMYFGMEDEESIRKFKQLTNLGARYVLDFIADGTKPIGFQRTKAYLAELHDNGDIVVDTIPNSTICYFCALEE